MSQVTHGVRSVLSIPAIYDLFGVLTGGAHARRIIAGEYVRAENGDRILDIGCGPASVIPYLPDVTYVGFDASPKYIAAAQSRFGDRGTFICERVSEETISHYSGFDVVLAQGVLHHLDDDEALQLFRVANAALKPGGRVITVDGCFIEDQSPSARYVLSQDRGQNTRTKEGYLQIASQVFSDITVSIRHDLLRIPYTHIILECVK